MRRLSAVANGNSLSIERTECGDLLRRRWLNATLRRIILPEPVILTRFAIALCVFSFCFLTLLSVFLFLRGKVHYVTRSDARYISCVVCKILQFSLFQRKAYRCERQFG